MPKNIDIITILPKGFNLTPSDIQNGNENIRFLYLDDESLAHEIEKSDIQIVIIDRDIKNFTEELYETIDKEFLSIYFNPIKLNEISTIEFKAIKEVQNFKQSIVNANEFNIDKLKKDLNNKIEAVSASKKIERDSTYLDAIEIKEYFSINNMKIEGLKDKKEIYFVGENGDGKTILLQAILLALKKDYSGAVIEHIRTMPKPMDLAVKDEYLSDYNSNVNIKNVFAYGINRNKIDSKLFDTYGYSGLFDTSDPRKTTYLQDPFSELGTEYQGDDELIKEFIEKLNSIILRENHQLFNGGDINFNELSEGYKSTVIWLYDLLYRLLENQKELEEKVKKLEDFKAIVLIDEVDLYLHPKWKYDFVYSLREVFKNIQFIMITHSGTTLLGASPDAVFYKIYKEDGETKISDQIPNRGYTNNTLISSPLFNLDTMTSRHYDKRKLSEDDYIYELIHEVVSQKIKEDVNLNEDAILKLIEEEFDKHEKN